jgi:hypothetical protein
MVFQDTLPGFPIEEDGSEEKKRKPRTSREIDAHVRNCECWCWAQSGSCKPRLYAVKKTGDMYRLVVLDTRRKPAQAEYCLLSSAEPLDLVESLRATNHEIVGKLMRKK